MKKRNLLISSAILGGLVLGTAIIVPSVLLTKKSLKTPSNLNSEGSEGISQTKTNFKTEVNSHTQFESSLSDNRFSSIKTKYEQLKAKTLKLIEESNNDASLQQAITEFRSELEKLKKEKEAIEFNVLSKNEKKQKVLELISSEISSTEKFIKGELNNPQYNDIKNNLENVFNELRAIQNNSNNKSFDMLKQDLEKLRSAVSNA
ncbi:hypothetical protein NW066_06030 [Mycoplasmopsis felis]|uniref:hypothetical protein n=1 Tax=Mycoplasmopsis felis TaxID=33923 RepID=UPI0021AF3E45|nr:hypothetical protein [Mycoplasmopsis felis]MCU9934039.1 hypothetical protein [Mycoplasmopsis felis]UWV85047.1 hypothetical protein NW066_06030 [Mycoplasmopsis felis]